MKSESKFNIRMDYFAEGKAQYLMFFSKKSSDNSDMKRLWLWNVTMLPFKGIALNCNAYFLFSVSAGNGLPSSDPSRVIYLLSKNLLGLGHQMLENALKEFCLCF